MTLFKTVVFDPRKVGKHIEDHRTQNHMTQQDVANALHVTIQAVSNWEKGKRNPDYNCLYNLSLLFECDMKDPLQEDTKEKLS